MSLNVDLEKFSFLTGNEVLVKIHLERTLRVTIVAPDDPSFSRYGTPKAVLASCLASAGGLFLTAPDTAGSKR